MKRKETLQKFYFRENNSRSAYISKKVKSIHACKYSELLINETLWKVNSVFFTICNKQPKIAYNS